jgi:hypothetical protein
MRCDGVGGAKAAAFAAATKAEALPKAYTRLADGEGGLKVEASLRLEGPTLSVSKTVMLPAWLKLWWIEQTPFGGLRKSFRRKWLAPESFESLERPGRALSIVSLTRQARVRGQAGPDPRTEHRSLDSPQEIRSSSRKGTPGLAYGTRGR